MKAPFHFAALFSVALPAVVLSLCAAGCAADAAEDGIDETSEDSAELRVRGNSGFFIVTRHDMRRCMSPFCGGYFVKRVNATSSRCGDGSYAPDCYVGGFDVDALGLSDEEKAEFLSQAEQGKAILRGGFEPFDATHTNVSRLTVLEGWRAAGGTSAPVGTSYRVTSSGIVCVVAPCPSLEEGKLNSSKTQKIHGLDLGTSASQADLDLAMASLGDKDGVLVTGRNETARGRGTKLVAAELYLRVKPAPLPPPPPPPVDQACGSRGMDPCPTGQFCQFETSAQCGALDHGGVCKTQPTICTKIYKPVCGCDGQTYGNECMAHSAGVSVSAVGACP